MAVPSYLGAANQPKVGTRRAVSPPARPAHLVLDTPRNLITCDRNAGEGPMAGLALARIILVG